MITFVPLKNTVPGDTHHTQTLGTGVFTVSTPLHGARIMMQAITQNIRYTLDGSTPSASSGLVLVAGDSPTYVELTRGMTLRFFRETSGAVLEYAWCGDVGHLGADYGMGVSAWRTKRGVVYSLRDDYPVAQSAPMTTPRAADPGPGTGTIVDTGNKLSIPANGRLTRSTTGVVAWTDPRIYYGGETRVVGKIMRVVITGTPNYGDMFGWRTAVTGGAANIIGVLASGTDFYAWVGPTSGQILCGSITAGADHVVCSILRSTGSWVVMDGKLMYVNSTSNVTPLYPSWQISDIGVRTTSLDYTRAWQLPAPWDSDWGIATGYTASPASGAELTHEADCLGEITWVASAGVTLELDVRRTDANNRWIVRCDQAGSTIKLIERNGGVETERSSAAQTWTVGTTYRIVVIADGQSIRTAVVTATSGASKNSYASAAFNLTATGALITAAAGVLSNFATWPRVLSGAALAALEKT